MTLDSATVPEIEQAIRTVPDFPRPGILFKDITPVLGDARLFRASVERLAAGFAPGELDAIAGIESRGFVFAAAAALHLGAAFVPVRKAGKLPRKTLEARYDLEYGSNAIAVHTDAVRPGARVLLLDDLLATGGTAAAAASLLDRLGAKLVGIRFLVELAFLRGREKLAGHAVESLIRY